MKWAEKEVWMEGAADLYQQLMTAAIAMHQIT